ncbi:MAG: DNA-binding protein [Actinoplanes sp.]
MQPFLRPDPAAQRSERTYAALRHLTDRHADTPSQRQRHLHPEAPSPDEVVGLMAALVSGMIPAAKNEPTPDETDLVAALTLIPQARANLENVELALLNAARARGMTWQDIAFSLGLSTPQAAQQRRDRLQSRQEDSP